LSSESAPHQLADAGAGRGRRPEQPEPFLRGCAWPGTRSVPYPRADPQDRMRIPGDTWQMASIPAGVRLELVGDAGEVEIAYRTETDQLGYRGAGAGRTFAAWTAHGLLAEEQAVLGEGNVRLPLAGDEPTIVYLPEGMRPTVTAVTGVGGDIAPAPRQPRWVVYGDSVAEGWIASAPALAWPAIAGRAHGLDVVNLGYAGAARGETASAEQVAALAADVLTVCHGTNCWTRTPHSAGMMRELLAAFLDIVRQEHPATPLLVVSPVVRPDAEATPNRLGATLADLREVMERVVTERIAAGDDRLRLLRGLDLIGAGDLGDGIHPDDGGHARMAAAIGTAVRAMMPPPAAG
jgi:lysophospholipase L1-like esterase